MGRTSELQLRAASERSICGIVKTVVSLPDKLFAVRPLQKHGVQWIAPAQDTAVVL